ncbi:MAG: hypothetical protein UAT33_00350 [Buchnera aphidicola (Floraphis choui)]
MLNIINLVKTTPLYRHGHNFCKLTLKKSSKLFFNVLDKYCISNKNNVVKNIENNKTTISSFFDIILSKNNFEKKNF